MAGWVNEEEACNSKWKSVSEQRDTSEEVHVVSSRAGNRRSRFGTIGPNTFHSQCPMAALPVW